MSYNPYTLVGKTILITGASSGIGRCTAIECAKLGAKLIIVARNLERLQAALDELSEYNSEEHLMVQADLTNEDNIKSLVDQLPQLDGFVCNAGIVKRAPLKFYSEELFDEHYKINVLSPMLIIRCLIRKKKLNTNASIVFTSSLAGVFIATNLSGMYGTSKSALNAYMKYAALELSGKNIRCNAVNPAMVETNLIDVSDEEKQNDLKNYPLNTYGEPIDVALGIIYLLSDASKWVTGIELKIDGGRSLK